jgi:hypothetical protein
METGSNFVEILGVETRSSFVHILGVEIGSNFGHILGVEIGLSFIHFRLGSRFFLWVAYFLYSQKVVS